MEDRSMKTVKIYIRGKIDEDWATWFEGLDLKPLEDGTTLMQGEIIDQSALYGLLAKLRDLGLELLAVEQMD
jgi:hypothetical protein